MYTGNILVQEAIRKFQLKTVDIPRNSVSFWNGQTLMAMTGLYMSNNYNSRKFELTPD